MGDAAEASRAALRTTLTRLKISAERTRDSKQRSVRRFKKQTAVDERWRRSWSAKAKTWQRSASGTIASNPKSRELMVQSANFRDGWTTRNEKNRTLPERTKWNSRSSYTRRNWNYRRSIKRPSRRVRNRKASPKYSKQSCRSWRSRNSTAPSWIGRGSGAVYRNHRQGESPADCEIHLFVRDAWEEGKTVCRSATLHGRRLQ